MTTRTIVTDEGFKARIDFDENNQMAFFDLTLPCRVLDEDDFRILNTAFDNLRN